MNELKRKNQTVTIYFGKERILSLPFEKVELQYDDDGNILNLHAADTTAKKATPAPVEKKAESKKAE